MDGPDPLAEILGSDLNVVLISNAVGDIETIGDGAAEHSLVVVYDAGEDDLSSIVSTLGGLTDLYETRIGSLAVFTHGNAGTLALGVDRISEANVEAHELSFQSLGGLFVEDGQIQFYACSLAGDASGRALVDSIASFASVDIFASDDPTGGIDGDWVLEYATSDTATLKSLLVQDWEGPQSISLELDGRTDGAPPSGPSVGTTDVEGVSNPKPDDLTPLPFAEAGFEDTVLIVDGWHYVDPEDDPAQSVKITSLPEHGTLFLDQDGDNTIDAGEAINTGQVVNWSYATTQNMVKFLGDANWYGTTSLDYAVTVDRGPTAPTPTETSGTTTATLTIGPTADLPTVTASEMPPTQSVNEGVYSSEFTLTAHDVDRPDPSAVNFVIDGVVIIGSPDEGYLGSVVLSDGYLLPVSYVSHDGNGNYTQDFKFKPYDGDAVPEIDCEFQSGYRGTLEDSGQQLSGTNSSGINLADLDGDGDLDIVEANWQQQNAVRFNDGAGNFSDAVKFGENKRTFNAAVGDIDGDGDSDIIAGNNEQANRVWLNDGSGSFTDSGQLLGNYKTTFVDLGDVDNDGDLDLVEANQWQPDKLYLNDGTGVFSEAQSLGGNWLSYYVGLGDVDDDGDLDLVVGTYVQNSGDRGTSIFLNDGTGLFTDTGQSLGYDQTYAAPLGDLDGDHDLDLFQDNYQTAARTYTNDGDGGYAQTLEQLGIDMSYTAALADIDGNATLDVIKGNFSQADTVWLNDGSGQFTDSGMQLGWDQSTYEWSKTWTIALGDVNGDSWVDVVEGNNNQSNRVYLNTYGEDQDASNTVQFTIIALNVPPEVVVSFEDLEVEEGVATDPIDLNEHFYDVPADLPLSFTHDDGNGNSGNVLDSEHFSVTYPDQGTYTVTITANDGDGGITEVTFDVTVNNAPPAYVDTIPDMTTDEGIPTSPINLNSHFQDVPADEPLSFTYDDGNGAGGSVSDPGSFTLLYEDDGMFTVSVTARDGDGGDTSADFKVTVNNLPPQKVDAIPNMTTAAGVATDPIDLRTYFTDVAADLPLSFKYDDGNGYTDVEDPANFSLTYDCSGVHTVTVTAVDKDLGETSLSFTVTIPDNCRPGVACDPLNIGGGSAAESSEIVFGYEGNLVEFLSKWLFIASPATKTEMAIEAPDVGSTVATSAEGSGIAGWIEDIFDHAPVPDSEAASKPVDHGYTGLADYFTNVKAGKTLVFNLDEIRLRDLLAPFFSQAAGTAMPAGLPGSH